MSELRTLAIIPDGNRRHSLKNNATLLDSYTAGFEKAEEVFDWVLELGTVKTATIFALSTENLGRQAEELHILTGLFDKYFRKLAENKKIHNNEVRVRIIGRVNQLNGISDSVSILQGATEDYEKFHLNIALAYGGRAEIIDAVKSMASEKMDFSRLAESQFAQHLYQQEDVDLLIRTGGTHRISNMLPWQCAYSELYFTDRLWPEFDRAEFQKAIDFYGQTKRRFGK
ncbi:MAG: polyprenyl diphosphate synthase [Candidatus Micrarchaeota archaeon]